MDVKRGIYNDYVGGAIERRIAEKANELGIKFNAIYDGHMGTTTIYLSGNSDNFKEFARYVSDYLLEQEMSRTVKFKYARTEEGAEQFETIYENYWSSIIEDEDGNIDMKQLKRELADYTMILREVPKVYSEFTSLSKPHTRAEHIISAINEQMIDREAAFEDLVESFGVDSSVGHVVIIPVDRLREYLEVKGE